MRFGVVLVVIVRVGSNRWFREHVNFSLSSSVGRISSSMSYGKSKSGSVVESSNLCIFLIVVSEWFSCVVVVVSYGENNRRVSGIDVDRRHHEY
jgi:hypothetical protein